MDEREIDLPLSGAGQAPDRQSWTRIYVWGYHAPRSLFLRERGESTEAAQRFAAEQGWDQTQRGAWAKELTLPMVWSLAWSALEPLVAGDIAVAGWSGRTP